MIFCQFVSKFEFCHLNADNIFDHRMPKFTGFSHLLYKCVIYLDHGIFITVPKSKIEHFSLPVIFIEKKEKHFMCSTFTIDDGL